MSLLIYFWLYRNNHTTLQPKIARHFIRSIKVMFWQSWNCNNYSALLLALLPKCIVHSVVCDSTHVMNPCVWLPFLPLSYPVHTAAVCISSHRGSLFSNGNLLKLIAVFRSRRDLYKPRRDLNKPRRDLKTKRCSEKISLIMKSCYTATRICLT